MTSPSQPATAAAARFGAPVQPPTTAHLPMRFEQVYAETFEFVFRTARRMRVQPSSIDDVVQDVYLTAHRRLASFDPSRGSVRAWMYGITTNVVSEHRRRYRRKEGKLVESDIDEFGEERFPSTLPPPSEAAERSQTLATLDRILAQMPAERREVLVLAHLEQLSVPEIAASIGQNVNTVYSRLRVARQEFEERLLAFERSAR